MKKQDSKKQAVLSPIGVLNISLTCAEDNLNKTDSAPFYPLQFLMHISDFIMLRILKHLLWQ
jgi:hypothetical protein